MKTAINFSVLEQAIKPKSAVDTDILEKALRPEEKGRESNEVAEDPFHIALMSRFDSHDDRLAEHDRKLDDALEKLDVALNMLSELQQMEIEDEDEEETESDDMPKALDLKAEIEKLGSVDEVEKDANNLPDDLAELLKGMEGDAPEAPAAFDDEDEEDDDLKKALDLIGDQPEIHCVEGTELHDLMKASSGHKYLRRYKTSSGRWAYVYAKQSKDGQDSYSAASFKLDKMSAGDKFNMGGGNFVKIDKIDGNMVSFTGADGKQKTMSAKAFGANLLAGHKKALTNAAKAGVKKREQVLAKAKEKNKPELVKKAQAELKSFQDKHKKLLTEKKEGKSLKEAFKQKQAGKGRGR